jgi:hypothetical protein
LKIEDFSTKAKIWGLTIWKHSARGGLAIRHCDNAAIAARLFKHIFRKIKVFDYKCDAFIKLRGFLKPFSEKWRLQLEI